MIQKKRKYQIISALFFTVIIGLSIFYLAEKSSHTTADDEIIATNETPLIPEAEALKNTLTDDALLQNDQRKETIKSHLEVSEMDMDESFKEAEEEEFTPNDISLEDKFYKFINEPPTPKEIFKQMDLNGDGSVFFKEFNGPTDLFAYLDLNRSGDLSFEEIEKGFNKVNERMDSAENENSESSNIETVSFRSIDTDGDNEITKNEFINSNILFALTDKNKDDVISRDEYVRPETIFNKLDMDNNGIINYTEFDEMYYDNIKQNSRSQTLDSLINSEVY